MVVLVETHTSPTFISIANKLPERATVKGENNASLLKGEMRG